MGKAKQRGSYEVRQAQAIERNTKLVAHIQATGNKKALAALHVVGPRRLATCLVASGMLYERLGPLAQAVSAATAKNNL